jgi:hypothetical protein
MYFGQGGNSSTAAPALLWGDSFIYVHGFIHDLTLLNLFQNILPIQRELAVTIFHCETKIRIKVVLWRCHLARSERDCRNRPIKATVKNSLTSNSLRDRFPYQDSPWITRRSRSVRNQPRNSRGLRGTANKVLDPQLKQPENINRLGHNISQLPLVISTVEMWR